MKKINILIFFVSCIFLFLYTGRGLLLLGFSNQLPGDFSLRWQEQCNVANGINPYDVSEHFYEVKNGKVSSIDSIYTGTKATGNWIASGYPPWAFFWANLFIPPLNVNTARLWFFMCNIFALAVLAAFSWSAVPKGTIFQRSFCVLSVISINAIGTTCGNGQWGLILTSIIILSSKLLTIGNTRSAGALFAIALLKPTFSFCHVTSFLARRTWGTLALIGILTLLTAWLAALQVGSGPLHMLTQMIHQTARWHDVSYSIPDCMIAIGLPRTPVIFGCLALAGLLSWWLTARQLSDSLYGLAAAGVLARVLSYHQLYDNILIIFLLLALVKNYFLNAKNMNFFWFAVVLLSLWIPGRFTHIFSVQVIQISLWCTALLWLTLEKNKLIRNS